MTRPFTSRVLLASAAVTALAVGCGDDSPLDLSGPTVPPPSPPPPIPPPPPAASWMLQGRLVYHSDQYGDFEIYGLDLVTREQDRLTRHAGRDVQPVVSPDGTKIAFVSDRDGSDDIFVMGIDGSDPVNLTHNPARDEEPTWSPDGTAIAFTSDRQDGVRHIWRMSADGANPVNLTWTEDLLINENWDPAWSPDGQTIAFASNREAFSENVYLMNPDGSNPRLLPGSPNDVWGWRAVDAPAWSPDGERVAFSAEEWEPDVPGSESSVIYASYARNDGGTAVLVTPHWPGVTADRPVWSPDGTMIAFEGSASSGPDIWIAQVHRSPGLVTVLTASPGVSEGSPSWY